MIFLKRTRANKGTDRFPSRKLAKLGGATQLEQKSINP